MKIVHLIAALIVWLSGHVLLADYVDFKDGSTRQFGLTVAESPELIELLIFEGSTSAKPIRRSFDRKAIEKHVKTIDVERLKAFTPSNLIEYRNYGEELASVTGDPVARKLAIRLFAICIANGDSKLQKSASLNLPQLAMTPNEKWKYNGLAFIYGGKRIEFESNEKQFGESMKRELLRLVQSMRREQFQKANTLISKSTTKDALESANRMTAQEIQAAIDARKIQPDLRVSLLRLESDLIAGKFSQPQDLNKLNQPELFKLVPKKPLPLPTIENTFAFDLQATRFQNGQWVRP